MNGIWRCLLSSKKGWVHGGGRSHTPIHVICGFNKGMRCSRFGQHSPSVWPGVCPSPVDGGWTPALSLPHWSSFQPR